MQALAGPPVRAPWASQSAVVHGSRRTHPGARHRGRHHDLQRHLQRDARSVSLHGRASRGGDHDPRRRRRLAPQYPNNYPKQFTVTAVSWVDSIVGPFKTALYTLAAAVALLLAISCFNVANMLLALATGREKEMAIRGALGAGRAHLVRQLLVESLLLASAGAALGCLFAYAGTKGIATLIPEGYIPREVVIRLNVPVLLFSLAAAVLTALIFGLAPALQAARRNGSRTPSGPKRSFRTP